MRLNIQAVEDYDIEALRALLIDAADDLVGAGHTLLESKLPWDGHPILLADADARPVLISFDLANSQAALVSGLHASDQLSAALPWVNQVYAGLQRLEKRPRLVVVTREPPPGYQAVLSGDQHLSLFLCRVLQVNDETGVLLEALNHDGAATHAVPSAGVTATPRPVSLTVATQPPAVAEDDPELALSDQEASYFQQL